MLKKNSLNKKNKGSALVVTLFVLAIILISALSITLTAVKERKASIGSSGSNRAYQASDEGIEKVMQAITRGNYATVDDMMTGAGFSCSSGKITGTGYEVELLDNSNNSIDCNTPGTLVSTIVRIKSVGTASGTKRATEALVSNKSTKLLMHFNGDDPPIDNSFYVDGYTINNSGVTFSDSTPTAVDSTKYGVFSDGNYLEIEPDFETVNNWNFDDNDFTIEAWVKIKNPAGANRYTVVSRCKDLGNPSSCNFFFNIARNGVINFSYFPSSGGLKTITYTNATITNDIWHHLVFERKGNDGYFFVDGTRHLASSGNFGSGDKIKFDSDTANELRIGINHNTSGAVDNSSQFIGSMDELRITKGVARWTTATFIRWNIEYAWND